MIFNMGHRCPCTINRNISGARARVTDRPVNRLHWPLAIGPWPITLADGNRNDGNLLASIHGMNELINAILIQSFWKLILIVASGNMLRPTGKFYWQNNAKFLCWLFKHFKVTFKMSKVRINLNSIFWLIFIKCCVAVCIEFYRIGKNLKSCNV